MVAMLLVLMAFGILLVGKAAIEDWEDTHAKTHAYSGRHVFNGGRHVRNGTLLHS